MNNSDPSSASSSVSNPADNASQTAHSGTASQSPSTAAIRYLSVERLKPYLRATAGHQRNALTLYRWNVAMSATVYQAIYFFEVALRNAIDEQLKAWNAGETSALGSRLTAEWCYEPAPLLDRLARKDIDAAYARAEKELHIKHGAGARRPNHDDVIAQTNLGLWRYLLPSSSDAGKQVLWTQAVSKAFPNLSRPPSQLVDAVHGVYLIRNRIAHLEPLIDQNVAAHYKNMITVMGDVSRDLQSWFASVTPEVSKALAARPTFVTQN